MQQQIWLYIRNVSDYCFVILHIARDEAEIEIQYWVTQYLKEIDRIEEFFKQNLKELKKEFRNLEQQYTSNKQVDDMGNIISPTNLRKIDTNDSIQIHEVANVE